MNLQNNPQIPTYREQEAIKGGPFRRKEGIINK